MSAPAAPQTVSVKLYGGPMDGRVVEVPRRAEEYRVGPFFTYEYAGKDGQQVMFAKRPASRAMRKFIRWHVGKFGRDPRIEACRARQVPVRNAT